jgi:hypothetical protein
MKKRDDPGWTTKKIVSGYQYDIKKDKKRRTQDRGSACNKYYAVFRNDTRQCDAEFII